MVKRPGLPLYQITQRLRGRGAAEARLARAVEAGEEDAARTGERRGHTTVPRPDGPLVWLHAGNEGEALGFPELIDRLRDERDELHFLVTTARHDPDHPLEARLPSDVILQYAPYDFARGAEAFVAHWKPDICIWAENRFEPDLIEAAGKSGTEMFLVDARVPERPGWRWVPGIRRALLRRFSYVLAGDKLAAEGLMGLGVSNSKIEAVGFLQEGTAPLPCSQAERDMIAEQLGARPVWLAAGVRGTEVDMVIDVHRSVMRKSHRLLLILLPQDMASGAALKARLEEDGWVVGLRSVEDEPEPEVEIFIADEPGELGLWYRLAPVTFMGGSLTTGALRNPFEAAALGSAVIYGPQTGSWKESYERLRDAGATWLARDEVALNAGLEHLLQPDKTAEMAAAAWEVTTNGAEATDRVVELVLEALDRRGV